MKVMEDGLDGSPVTSDGKEPVEVGNRFVQFGGKSNETNSCVCRLSLVACAHEQVRTASRNDCRVSTCLPLPPSRMPSWMQAVVDVVPLPSLPKKLMSRLVLDQTPMLKEEDDGKAMAKKAY